MRGSHRKHVSPGLASLFSDREMRRQAEAEALEGWSSQPSPHPFVPKPRQHWAFLSPEGHPGQGQVGILTTP